MLFLDLFLLKVLIREDPIPNECYSVIDNVFKEHLLC